ncbi:hypothetical protein SLEP1_g56290 [Rubroshorea leprosula]|uniref:Secreted protein n=1 Tax=Rubroshorea leprosula TaxID=152421 RepID=A0AAV5ML12_9ROSI|nr:hypothetical protein SLEP1_g56290 [Rubroshorea leprosula]
MMIITRTSIFAFLQLLMIESAVGQALVKPGCRECCGSAFHTPLESEQIATCTKGLRSSVTKLPTLAQLY